MVADVKEILYSVINEIGKDKIRAELSADTDAASRKYSKVIAEKCVRALERQVDDETLAVMCEALLHFMLTASVLPSERKVSLGSSELDLVIPSVKNLIKDPSRTLVIQVDKDGGSSHIIKAEKAQPHVENLWVISAKPLETGHRNYSLTGNFPSLIPDIRAFLHEKGVHSLKMLHG